MQNRPQNRGPNPRFQRGRPNGRGRPGSRDNRRPRREPREQEEIIWNPRTVLGKQVKAKEITDISQIINKNIKVREAEVIDNLLPNLETDFILIGQAHGKFGGGKRRLVKQTQKKTAEGNKPAFTACAVVGNRNGYVGYGIGTAKETIPGKEKAVKKAKMSIMEIARGCGSWKCACGEPHSLPFEVEGKCGSVRVKLMPAPKGKGLVVDKEIKKIMELAGISDVWAKTTGQTRQKMNFVKACFRALAKGSQIRVKLDESARVKYGKIQSAAVKIEAEAEETQSESKKSKKDLAVPRKASEAAKKKETKPKKEEKKGGDNTS
jgi:small subunit ribosomal protein S5